MLTHEPDASSVHAGGIPLRGASSAYAGGVPPQGVSSVHTTGEG